MVDSPLPDTALATRVPSRLPWLKSAAARGARSEPWKPRLDKATDVADATFQSRSPRAAAGPGRGWWLGGIIPALFAINCSFAGVMATVELERVQCRHGRRQRPLGPGAIAALTGASDGQ